MLKAKTRLISRKRRHRRVRRKITGIPERPRLNVFRSSKHIYAQVIDDQSGKTLVAASSLDPELRTELPHGGNREAAHKVGVLLARKAMDRGIKDVVFDRAGYLYHGRIKELAEGAREGGLNF
ncbi:MAG: 50S ribosomal protein L18 [Bacillota bacterium]|nr:50S ribosomal protein L18 [Bacillota bacterium]